MDENNWMLFGVVIGLIFISFAMFLNQPDIVSQTTATLQVVNSQCTYRDTLTLKDLIVDFDIRVVNGSTRSTDKIIIHFPMELNYYNRLDYNLSRSIDGIYNSGGIGWDEEFLIQANRSLTLPMGYRVYYCSKKGEIDNIGCVKIYSGSATPSNCNLWSMSQT